jgi:hypothetical protein
MAGELLEREAERAVLAATVERVAAGIRTFCADPPQRAER